MNLSEFQYFLMGLFAGGSLGILITAWTFIVTKSSRSDYDDKRL